MTNLILLIDDDKITNFVNKKVLSSKFPGIKIKDFTSAGNAFEYLKKDNKLEEYATTIFLDINMPEISGWEFIKMLEKEFPQMHYELILLTSSIDEKDIERSEKFRSVDAFISKPLTPSKLEKVHFL